MNFLLAIAGALWAIVLGVFRLLERVIFFLSIFLTFALYLSFILVFVVIFSFAVGYGFNAGMNFSW
jgi:hypothetical protein